MGESIAKQIAIAALKIGAIRLQPRDPFTWTTGYRMPIYNDNRRLLSLSSNRSLVAQGFKEIIDASGISFKVIAGTATGGISPATTLADLLQCRFCYVRSEAKGHALKNKVEGLLETGDQTLLIEDLISTGKSSVAALAGLREKGAVVQHCLAIFSYCFSQAEEAFAGAQCSAQVLLSYPQLLSFAREANFISAEEENLLSSWYENPFGWGEKYGFPRVEK